MRNPVVYAILAMALMAAAGSSGWAAEQGARVEYVGGTHPNIPNNADGVLQAIDEQYLVFYSGKANLRVAYERIDLLEYGQKVDRRIAMAVLVSPVFALSKKRQHFKYHLP